MNTKDVVFAAFEHVRQYHPEVTHVFYSFDGRWQYTDDDFNAPTFAPGIDVSLLADAAQEVVCWPAAFYFGEFDV